MPVTYKSAMSDVELSACMYVPGVTSVRLNDWPHTGISVSWFIAQVDHSS